MTHSDGRSVDQAPRCRFCDASLEVSVVDLGMSPPCQSLVAPEAIALPERFYPLHVRVCTRCWLVQLPEHVAPDDIFREYAYFSAYSTSWVEHAREYVDTVSDRFGLGADDLVVELASNDGYLLQHFVGTEVPILGIDPASNVARAAEERGVPTLVEFFGRATAHRLVQEGRSATLVVANNVIAQVPDLNDFIAGVALLLAPRGTATFEFPQLRHLLDRIEYDTIYHEHYSYFSLRTFSEVLRAHGLHVYDVEELPTHGGSLRVYAQHADGRHELRGSVAALLEVETRSGLQSTDRYARFARDVQNSKHALLELLLRLRRDGKHVVGYGAPGKGNTLLNYCGIRGDILEYTVDRNPYKQGMYTPGTRIPIYPEARIAETRPDYVLVLPWNLIDEISPQLAFIAEWGAKLIVPVPEAHVLEPGAPDASAVKPAA